MADGFLGDIANMVGGTLTPEIAEVLKGLPEHIGELMTTQNAEVEHMLEGAQLQPLLDALQVDVATPGGDATTAAVDAATGAIDATAEPAPFALPAGVDAAELQSHLEGFADRLQALQSDGEAKLTSADPNEQAHGQLLMQQSQALMDQVQSVLQNMSNDAVDAVQNLHSNADGEHDAQGTVVAIADSGDGHLAGHVDQDASADHQVDHTSAPPAHDDGATADPSTTA